MENVATERTSFNEQDLSALGIDLDWIRFLNLDDFEADQLITTTKIANVDRERYIVYPPLEDVHRWSRLCKPEDVKVVILGQDPYPDGSASGLAFGTVEGGEIPPSLLNIFKELERSMPSFQRPRDGCLDNWCPQGVLLLNSIFTVIRGKPGSHSSLGWQMLCGKIVRQLSVKLDAIVFMLWGRSAQEMEYLIDTGRHLVLKSSHPSPRVTVTATPFLGNGHFLKANEFLHNRGRLPIDWAAINKRD